MIEPGDYNAHDESSTERILAYATCLGSYFDALIQERGLHALELAGAMARRYHLSDAQVEDFKRVAVRTFRAQSIVRYLENRCGADDEGIFTEPQELHRVLLRGRYVPRFLTARSYHIAIGFRKHHWRYPDRLGYAINASCDVLFNSLDTSLWKLEHGKPTTCRRLIFFSRDDLPSGRDLRAGIEPCAQVSEDRNLGARGEAARTALHEIRHVVDHILGAELTEGCLSFVETSAHLATYESFGLTRDLRATTETLTRRLALDRKCLDRLTAPGSHTGAAGSLVEVLESRSQRLRLQREVAEAASARCRGALARIPRVEWPRVSYVVSMTHGNQIPEVLERVAASIGVS